MARTSHTVRSATCSRCSAQGATLRCGTCQSAYYCTAACMAADDIHHRQACSQVSGARDRASQQSSPPLELLVAVSDLVAVVEREAAQVQMSYAFTTSSPDTPMSGCQSFPLLCSLSEPSSPSSPSLPSDNAFWLPCTVAATLDYIEYQAPGLLHPCVADLLLEAACVLRDMGQSYEPHLVAWALLSRCLLSGLPEFRDSLALEAVREKWVLDGPPTAFASESSKSDSSPAMDTLMASFPILTVLPTRAASQELLFGGVEDRGWAASAQKAQISSWLPPQAAEVLSIMAPLTVTVHMDSPLLSSSLELDINMRMLCRV